MKKKDKFAQHSIHELMHTDFIALKEDLSVGEALEQIRQCAGEPRIMYFYVVNEEDMLKGVVSTRQLLISPLDAKISEIMDTKVHYLTEEVNIMDVLNDFITHKYLALPVVDKEERIIGVVDVSVFTENIPDILERENSEAVFETIGFRIYQIKGASAFQAFRYRFPWLIATITSGVLCALMSSRFENVLASSLILSFFLTLVLGLGESVSMQSMTVTIQALRVQHPTFKWFSREIIKEFGTAILLGLASGAAVAASVLIWKQNVKAALVIGGSLVFTLTTACLIGLAIPTTLHALKLDPKVSAGPLTLGIADIITILTYLTFASVIL
jgi:magnesium transporter